MHNELTDTFTSIETYIPPLKGLLLPAIPDAPLSDEELIQYHDQLDLLQQQTGIFSTGDQFSQAYEYWIEQFAKMTLKRGVSFYTPRSLARMLIEIVKPREGMTVYDPTAGTGGMLISAANYIRQRGGSLDNTYFYGRELSADIWAIGKMNVLAHQIQNTTIEQGDSLNETFETGSFDILVQNLPLPPDPGNRVQTRRLYDAFLRHALESLSANGRAAILSPSFVLQQNHQEIWRSVLGRDWLEAVITLPSNLLHGTNGGAAVFVFNKRKAPERRLQVLFIQLSSPETSRSRRLELTDNDLQPVVQSFDSWGSMSDYSRVVPVSQIEANDYSLNIERYPDLNAESQSFNVAALLNRYQSAIQKREAAVEQLMKTLEDLHYSSGDQNL